MIIMKIHGAGHAARENDHRPGNRAYGKLLVVGTPIGNLKDITGRAVEALRESGLIAAEDTRRTRKLLSHLGISRPMVSYRAQNHARQTPRLIQMMQEGKTLALVTDAGMPGISDPGFFLVREAAAAGITVIPIPGVSALTTALSISGFPSDRFVFEGFLPQKAGRRKRRLEELAADTRTVAIFESPHRIISTTAMLAMICPAREVTVVRELTKVHEEIIRGCAAEVAEKIENAAPRGEYTLIIGPRGKTDK